MKKFLFVRFHVKLLYIITLLFGLCAFFTCVLGNDNFIGAFYSLEEVLNVFKKDEMKNNPSAEKLIKIYEALVEDVGNTSLYASNNPFIAIEGNHRTRKFIVSRQLARALKGTNLRNPPELLNFLKFNFKELEAKRAFYSLALYANALEARRILQDRPVVTAGYWLDIAAFALAKKYPIQFPDKNSSEMKWPNDLLAPDIIFYINTPPHVPPYGIEGYITKQPNPLKPRLVDVYRRWTYPRVVELSGSVFSYNEMFTEMFRHINFIRQSKFKQYLSRTVKKTK